MSYALGFIGGGNMAGAIIRGLELAGKKLTIRVADLDARKLAMLASWHGIVPASSADVAEQSDVLILAVKPNNIQGVVQDLSKHRLQGKLVITIAAGLPLRLYEDALPDTAVVRVMPNTSAAVLQAMSGLARGRNVTDAQAAVAEEIFGAIGQVMWLPEEKLNALMAVSGSGPAYYYLFTECLIKAGVSLGLTEAEAEILARETLVGAGAMLRESGKPARQLREEVTSPKGTTLEALKMFWQADLEGIVRRAAEACVRRGEEMEKEFLG